MGSRRAHVHLDCALADFEAELEQFSADPLGTPESVRRRYGPDQRGGLRIEARRGACSAPPPPESLEASAVPPKKRFGLDDPQHVPPGRSDGIERFLRRVRTEVLDHVLVLDERRLERVLREYVKFFNGARPHQGLGQRIPGSPAQTFGANVTAFPVLGGLHHDYRRAA